MENIYLFPFILCILLLQGIFGTILGDDIGEPSNLLVRNKRVINRIPGEDVIFSIQDFPYVARVRRKGRVVCGGTILSQHTVITAARCITQDELPLFTVSAGSGYKHTGQVYNIIRLQMHGHHPPRSFSFTAGIALLTVNPPFEFSHTTGRLELHTGLVLAGMEATIAGWGNFYYRGLTQTEHPRSLRSITVPIINHQECVSSYRHYFNITEADICTYHQHKQCGLTDTGSGLVIDNLLVGVYMGVVSTVMRDCHLKPDVFALVQHQTYSQWIRENIVH